MRITNFSYNDKKRAWRFDNFIFDRLTLLVGASGVGKTQVLSAIKKMADIAKGKSYGEIVWRIEFSDNGNDYTWEGEFDKLENTSILSSALLDEDVKKANIKEEKLYLNKKILIERNKREIVFKGSPIVKLAQNTSIVNLLKEEKEIKPIFDAFSRIKDADYSDSNKMSRSITLSSSLLDGKKLLAKYDSLKKIQESNEDTLTKYYLVSLLKDPIVEEIKNRFIEIFPQVKDVKIEPADESTGSDLPVFLNEYPFIQIKEKSVKSWIMQSSMSSGMYRTLCQLCDLYLCSEGTVFLIDEFENSLGVNCLGELTNEFLNLSRNIQYIITSHHPYIINQIPITSWKLITRKGGVVKEHNVEELNIGKSKHDAFMQLIQLDEFRTGQEQ